MDKIKVKYITLDEMKNIDPSLIKSMTFTDGSVVIVNSDNGDEKIISDNKEINQDIFNQEEKEPDIQDNPNIYFDYDLEENINNNINKNKNQKINNNQQRIYYTQNLNIIPTQKSMSNNNNQNIRHNNINTQGYSFQNEKYKKK